MAQTYCTRNWLKENYPGREIHEFNTAALLDESFLHTLKEQSTSSNMIFFQSEMCIRDRAGTGRFVAYLDADDIWKPDKLEKQTQFMKEKKCGFSCTSYEVINDAGQPLNKYVHMLPKVDYVGFLTNNLLQTVGIMVDRCV